ncbi:hypothetical protein CCACVL1_27628 [Corchorus capsularis]|uniref:Uncharacterized protein n=1 Tax=Corchorus capsularis TaxID=210143 RepID=A0A1R3G9I2_COCAP|nr:hypothetical protein CCACVL1_27628 [Corchorus capsularis]
MAKRKWDRSEIVCWESLGAMPPHGLSPIIILVGDLAQAAVPVIRLTHHNQTRNDAGRIRISQSKTLDTG